MLRSLLLISLIAVSSAQYLNLTQKNVSQSSKWENRSAERAVDGDRTTCSHTECHPDAWWRIDLLGVYNISSVTIYNSISNFQDPNTNLSGAQIHISYSLKGNGTANSRWLNITNLKNGFDKEYSFNQGASGRYITVFSSATKCIILCELKITGTLKDSPFELIPENKTWERALEYCRAQHMELATIINEETQAWAELAAMNATTSHVWLGLRYTCTLSFWFWITDHTVDFDRWESNGSRAGNCDESAAMSRENHTWVPTKDEEMYNFICSKRSFW